MKRYKYITLKIDSREYIVYNRDGVRHGRVDDDKLTGIQIRYFILDMLGCQGWEIINKENDTYFMKRELRQEEMNTDDFGEAYNEI